MPRRTPQTRRQQAQTRIEALKQRLTGFDLVCSGTLHKRTKVCGKPGCRCAHDKEARHGPYYEWSRRKGGRLVHRVVSPRQAARLKAAIANYRAIRRLLRSWEEESTRILEAENELN